MGICQVMIQDFMYKCGGFGEYYTESDLVTGIQYCTDLIEFEGASKEPLHGYDLREFINWANRRIES